MNKNNLIMILAVGAGGYLAYWYVTKHGPGGVDAAGNLIGPSYWDTWFSNASVPAVAGGQQTTQQTTQQQTQQTTQQQTTQSQPVTGGTTQLPPNPTGPAHDQRGANTVPQFSDPTLLAWRNGILAAAGSSNINTVMNADGWSYYLAQVTGQALTPDQFQSAFPAITATDRGGNITADQFLTALYKSQHGGTAPGMSGLGMIVRSPNLQPSMAFSGARRGSFSGKGYIQ